MPRYKVVESRIHPGSFSVLDTRTVMNVFTGIPKDRADVIAAEKNAEEAAWAAAAVAQTSGTLEERALYSISIRSSQDSIEDQLATLAQAIIDLRDRLDV